MERDRSCDLPCFIWFFLRFHKFLFILPNYYISSFRPESTLVEAIVADILKKLNVTSPARDFKD